MSDHPAGKRRLKIPAGVGALELRVRTFYHELDVTGPEAETLKDLGVMQARLIDTIPTSEKWHLLGTAQKSLLDINDRLVKLARPAGEGSALKEDELDGFLAGLTPQPRPS